MTVCANLYSRFFCIFVCFVKKTLQLDRHKSRVQRSLETLSVAFSILEKKDHPVSSKSSSSASTTINLRMEQINNNMSSSLKIFSVFMGSIQ
jgi:hypothetical protein